jgi:hypothetical protein
MDISQMSEEDQLQAAMQLSMQDISSVTTQAAPVQLRLPDREKARTFPRKDVQDVLASSTRSTAKKIRSEPRLLPSGSEARLSDPEVAEWLKLVFGDRPEAADVERWLNVGFQFSPSPGVEWGLWQRHGGPCGVFAPVQAFILKHLLFHEGENAVADAEKRKDQPLAASGTADDERGSALAHALSSILYSATPTSSYAVCQVSVGKASSADAAKSITTGSSCLEVTVTRASRIADVQQLFEEGVDTWLAGPCGVLSFICTVLMSRTCLIVKEDMDDPQTPLIGRFGHCSQELVNLMLIGEAISNVFDGSRWLGDDPSSGLLVKGVDGDKVGIPTVGLLSELEPMRYVQVGTLYKNPDFPIWVLGSPTHYTLLFTTRRSDSQLSPEDQLEQKAKKVFVDNSLDDGGLAMGDNLSKLLEGMGIGTDRLSEARRDLVNEDIILWDDFRRWTRRQFGLGSGAEASCQDRKVQLFLYDGQDPPGPTLRSVAVETNDIDPALAGGGDSDAFSATLHTRWPNSVVTVKAIAGAVVDS